MLENVITALGENSEAVAELNDFISSNQTNVGRIGTLEGELSDAISRRKSLHGMISKATGLSDITEEALTNFSRNADEGLRSDNETLQASLAKLTEDFNGLGTKHETEISEMVLKDTLRSLGIGNRVQNDRAFTELTKLVLNGATREGAVFTFKEDGKTLYGEGGKALNVEDRISQLQEGEYSYLFKPVTGGGGGNGGGNNAPNNSGKSSDEDKAAYFRKHGALPPDAYK